MRERGGGSVKCTRQAKPHSPPALGSCKKSRRERGGSVKFQKNSNREATPHFSFLSSFFCQLPRAEGECAFLCVLLHFTLSPPLSLITFFIWQEERKGRREYKGDFIIEKKEVRKIGEEGAASALARCALPRAGGE